jgi:hypothetical protein
MSDGPTKSSTQKASLYQEFLAERDQIMKHKWVMSENANSDVGFEAALVDWTINVREGWKKDYKKAEKKLSSK